MIFFSHKSNGFRRKLRTAMSVLMLVLFVPASFGQVPPPAPATPAPDPAAAAPVPPPAPATIPTPAAPAVTAPSGPATYTARPNRSTGSGLRLKHRNTTIDLILADYAERTGRTLLMAQGLPKSNVTLESQSELTLDEYLQAIEKVLGMNGIALVRDGEKFLKVVAIGQARMEAEMPIRVDAGAEALRTTGELVSQMLILKHITSADAQQAITALKHPYAQIQVFDRSNAILLTDTSANIKRVIELIGYIDQPMESREQPNIRQIKYSQASLIKAKLEEVIASAQEDAAKTAPKARTTGGPALETAPAPAGVIRANPRVNIPTPAGSTATEDIDAGEAAERGIIQGKVKIIADDRTNLLILITRIENMVFFDRIITVLDVETAPDVSVQVVRLEYAVAEELASSLNALIGAVEKPKDSAQTPTDKTVADKSADLKQYAEQLRNQAAAEAAASADGANQDQKSKFGELSAQNIKILADKRINSLIIMSSRSDFSMLQEMIRSMDVMVSQVALDVVIFRISLNNADERGVDWVQRAMMTSSDAGDPLFAFAGAGGGDNDRANMADPMTLTSVDSLKSTPGNLSYYFTFFDLNLDAIIKLVASDNRSKIISSPKIITADNEEAMINVTQEKYFYNGKKLVGNTTDGRYEDDVTMKKIGLKLTFTPRINPKKMVALEIKQTVEDEGAPQSIGDATWPTINGAEMTATVAVRSDETIVLGGIQQSTTTRTHKKIPFLGDLPVLGVLFSYTKDTEDRNELVIFITPRVLDTPEEVAKNAIAIKNAVGVGDLWPRGWADSKLADPTRRELYQKQQEEKEKARRERKEAKIRAQQEKEEAKVKAELEKKQAEELARAEAMKTPEQEPISFDTLSTTSEPAPDASEAKDESQNQGAPGQPETVEPAKTDDTKTPAPEPEAAAPAAIPSQDSSVAVTLTKPEVETIVPYEEPAAAKSATPNAATMEFIQAQEERSKWENVAQPQTTAPQKEGQ